MKIRFKNSIIASALSLCALAGCTGDFDDINTNPNKIVVGQIKASGMFEPLLYNGANAWLNYSWYWNNELIQFTAFTGGTTRQEHRYFISNGNWQSVWNLYARYGNNAVHMYDLATEQNEYSLQAIALTLKVLYMSNLTDMFGDIPYEEAFSARKPGGTTKPKYDTQRDVYLQMFNELETANEIYASNPLFIKPALDGMYGGDMQKWRKFNNSLYLRLINRVSGREEMNASDRMTAIISNPDKYPVFEGNEDNATVKFTGIDPYRNEFADTNESSFTSSGRKITEQFIKMTVITQDGVQVYEDPRMGIYAKKNTSTKDNPDNIWKGTVAGCTEQEQSTVDKGTAWLNTSVMCRADAPGYFMDYAEIQFILADSAYKNIIQGGEQAAKNYYENAVRASIYKWAPLGVYSSVPVDINDAQIDEFLSSRLASWDLNTNKEELIANQKFLALFWIGMEAYHEYRRTGYPSLTIGAGTVFNDFKLPTRFAYPTTSLATNSANVQSAIDRLGGVNDMKSPIWWSKEAISK